MNLQQIIFSTAVTLFIALFSVNFSFADHNNPDGSFDEELAATLQNASEALNYQVQVSSLRVPVKASVAKFASEVSRLRYCSLLTPSDDPIRPNLIIQPFDHNSDNCEYTLQKIRSAWMPVERYLYDTYYDYPHIYQRYLQVRQSLYEFLGQ
ncbi:MAG: hypothetical protein HQK50_06620 [Oligoflexia bacterium]|nr:hypothetical protein [Oligoflexia bacterium]MBF0365226.1 hypothetical protein [Oligoflexia bacterium]